MNQTQIEKIKRFMNDKVMSDTVLGVIKEVFIGSKNSKDVYYLAAKSLSLEFLEEAEKELFRYKDFEEESSPKGKQVGL